MTLVVDDAQLSRLAIQPAQDAAEALNRPAAFRPVVLLCCVLPPLWFASWSTLDGNTAGWALRALAVRHAQRLEEWFEPGVQWKESTLRAAPPLGSWLTASIMPLFPEGTAGAAVAISALSMMGASAMLWLWCREAVGERTALLVILLFAFHPQVAPLAASGEPTALTLFLLLTSAWGFWGHLDQNSGSVSVRLLAGGLAWGLAMLAGGGIAIAFFAVLMLVSLVSQTTQGEETPRLGERSAVRAVLLLGVTGAAIALWWPVMMVQSQGTGVLQDWIGIAAQSSLDSSNADSTADDSWPATAGALLGWWCLGLWASVRISVFGPAGREQRWNRWILAWSALGIIGRITWAAIDGTDAALRSWDVFLSLPALILAAQGLDRAIRRETTRVGLAAAIATTVGGVTWESTHHIGVALLVGVAMLGILLLSAPLTIGLRRVRSSWSEEEIRAWVLVAALATIVGHATVTMLPLADNRRDHHQWEQVRRQLASIDTIRQTSIVSNDQRDLTPWIYLLRSLWPSARLSVANGWDPEITSTLITEAKVPQSRMVVLDWSRSGLRVRSDVGTGWQIDSVLEPRAFRHRRLAAYLIHPVGDDSPTRGAMPMVENTP